MYYRKHGKPYEPVYEKPGRTKQSFIEECDINNIIARAAKAGTISHLEKWGAQYGDFTDAPTDLLEAKERLERGQRIFDELPAEIRREFAQNPFAFFEFVNDPANKDDLKRVLPQLAERGTQLPDIANKGLLAEAQANATPSDQTTSETRTETNGTDTE